MSTTVDHSENPGDSMKESQVYELGYLVLPSIAEDKLPETVAKLKKIITDNGGSLLDSEDPFLQDLAYSMSKVVGASKYVVNNAYIGWQKFEAEPSTVEAMKAEVEKIPEILRYLLIKTTRETYFTFADARKALEEEEVEESEEAPREQGEALPEVSETESKPDSDTVVE